MQELQELDTSNSLPPIDNITLSDSPEQTMRPETLSKESLDEYGCQRRLMRTSKGYLALASRCVRVDDEVWLPGGGPTPFILRPLPGSDGHYSFLAECYVHGIMNGEAVQETEGFSPITIV